MAEDAKPTVTDESRGTDTLGWDQRSVSEVVGYVLVFALVLTSVSLVTFAGFSTLQDARDSEQAANAERAFDVVADNMAAVYERQAPSRSTEIDLGETELFYGDPISMTVTVNDGEVPERHEYIIRPVELRVSDRTTLVYEAGAVIRDQREGGIMLREPPFLLNEKRVHVPIVQTTSAGSESAAGTTILLRGESTDREALVDSRTAYEEVTIEIISPRYEIWERYFEESLESTDCDTDAENSRVTCTLDLDPGDPATVYVTHQGIDLSIIR